MIVLINLLVPQQHYRQLNAAALNSGETFLPQLINATHSYNQYKQWHTMCIHMHTYLYCCWYVIS